MYCSAPATLATKSSWRMTVIETPVSISEYNPESRTRRRRECWPPSSSQHSSVSVVGFLRSRISELPVHHLQKGRQHMFCRRLRSHDVAHVPSFLDHCIRDQRAVASPWNRLCTHDCSFSCTCNPNQRIKALRKLRRRHVIGISSEGIVAPTEVD